MKVKFLKYDSHYEKQLYVEVTESNELICPECGEFIKECHGYDDGIWICGNCKSKYYGRLEMTFNKN